MGVFTAQLQTLKDGLRFFGLDPQDWQIKAHDDGVFLIHHLQDPELQMEGVAFSKGQDWEWQEISIQAV